MLCDNPPPEPAPALLVLVGEGTDEVCEADEVETTFAPFEDGVETEEEGAGVFAATGIVDEPAVTVEVAVATAPPATAEHANKTAGIPFGPSKKQLLYWRSDWI